MTYVYQSHPARIPLGPYARLLEELSEARRLGLPAVERVAIITRYRALWGCMDDGPEHCTRGPQCIDCFLQHLLTVDA